MAKKIFLVIPIVLLSLASMAQNNLQFNRTVRIKYSGFVASASMPVVAGTITVPENKVWKIESGSAIDSLTLSPIQFSLLIDGQLLYTSGTYSSNTIPYSAPPIWIGAGTYPVSVSLRAGGDYYYAARISAIEFNLTP